MLCQGLQLVPVWLRLAGNKACWPVLKLEASNLKENGELSWIILRLFFPAMIESSYWGHIKTEGVVPSLFYGGDVRMQQDGQKSGLWEIRLLSGCSSESPRLRWSVGKGFILFCCY